MIPTDCMTGTNIAKWKFRLAARPGAPAPPLTLPPQGFAAFDGRSTGVPPSGCASLPCLNPLRNSPPDLPRPCRIRAFLRFARPVEPDPGRPIQERLRLPLASCGNAHSPEQPFQPRHDRSAAFPNCTRPRLRHDTAGNGSTAAERSPDARPSSETLPIQLTVIICRSYITHWERLTFSPFKLRALPGAVHIISNPGPSDTARAVE